MSARSALSRNAALHAAVAEVLIQRETLDGQEFQRIVGDHPVQSVRLPL